MLGAAVRTAEGSKEGMAERVADETKLGSINRGLLGATLGAAVGYDWVGLRTDDAVGHGTDNGFHRHSHTTKSGASM